MDGTPSDGRRRDAPARKRGTECKKEALNRASRATAPPKRWAVKIEEIEGERLHVDCPNTEADSEAGREGQNNYHGISVTLARTFSELAEHPGVRARERGRHKKIWREAWPRGPDGIPRPPRPGRLFRVLRCATRLFRQPEREMKLHATPWPFRGRRARWWRLEKSDSNLKYLRLRS